MSYQVSKKSNKEANYEINKQDEKTAHRRIGSPAGKGFRTRSF
jgi:hypothetical protein